jgi:hypothetical protein
MKQILSLSLSLVCGVICTNVAGDNCPGDPITPSDLGAGDYFGWSISIDRDFAVVSSVLDDLGVFENEGSAYIYERSLLGPGWVERQKLTSQVPLDEANFGTGVSISGNVIAVSEPHPFSTTQVGVVYPFRRDPSQPLTAQWSQEGPALTASDGLPGDYFGGWAPFYQHAVSTNGNLIVVGALGADVGGHSSAGKIYLFEYQGGSTPWIEVEDLTAPTPQAGGGFGTAVAISGRKIIVGAPGTDVTHSNQGLAAVYRYDTVLAAWVLEQHLLASDPAEGAGFGQTVAIDGNNVIVGAPGRSTVYFMRYTGSAWVEEQKASTADSQFGVSVSISGSLAVVGSWLHFAGPDQIGTAYVYQRTGGSPAWNQVLQLLSSQPDDADEFGFTVAIDGDDAVIAAIGDDDAGAVQGGSVAIYGDLPSCP